MRRAEIWAPNEELCVQVVYRILRCGASPLKEIRSHYSSHYSEPAATNGSA
jgi:hypothetical protein